MPNAKDIDVTNLKVKCVAYGASGTGKTRFGGTWPKPYFADFDNGMLSLRGRDIQYDTFMDLFRGGKRYKSGWQDFNAKLGSFEEGKVEGVESLIVDSVTLAMSACIMDMAILNGHAIPHWKDYGAAVEPLSLLFKRLRALPIHVLIVAHEEYVKVESSGELLFYPLLIGKRLGVELVNLFDEVYRANVGVDKEGNPEYQLLTVKNPRYHAKSRLGCMDAIEKPDFHVLMKKVQEEAKKNAAAKV